MLSLLLVLSLLLSLLSGFIIVEPLFLFKSSELLLELSDENKLLNQLTIFVKKPWASSFEGKFSAALLVASIIESLPNIESFVSPNIPKSSELENKLENQFPIELKNEPIELNIPELPIFSPDSFKLSCTTSDTLFKVAFISL